MGEKMIKFLSSFINKHKNPKAHFHLVDVIGGYVAAKHPPVLAKDINPFFKNKQKEKYDGEYKFAHCPGMFDYTKSGYIIPAWVKMEFKANKAGSCIKLNWDRIPPETSKKFLPRNMDHNIVDGVFNYDEGIKQNAWNCPGPWAVVGLAKNFSLMVMPAMFHNSKLNCSGISSYPGMVDYNDVEGFHTLNFVCSLTKNIELTIEEGEPLLHIIPTQFNYNQIKCEYGFADNSFEQDMMKNPKLTGSHFYKRFYMKRKKYSIEAREDIKKVQEKYK